MEERNVEASLILQPDDLFYLSGFKAIIYSRPFAYLVESDGLSMALPSLEEEHVRKEARADRFQIYHETPERIDRGSSFLAALDALVSPLRPSCRLGVEKGYLPLDLGRFLEEKGFVLVDVGRDIALARTVKEPKEIEAITLSGDLVSYALRASLERARPGMTEMELDLAGTSALFARVARDFPSATVDHFVMSPSGRERSAMQHVFSSTRALQLGDGVIHSRQVGLNGYRAECERTFFVGLADPFQRRCFAVMAEAQAAAVAAVRPGVRAGDVDGAARRVIDVAGFGEAFDHRTGHGIGVTSHEEPSLRFDNEVVLKEGMALSIEPGFYLRGRGGFRHSDTVIVTAGGARQVTSYPKDLESLVIG